MSGPLVTIGIPTYNRAGQYLKKTLESALAQKYEHIEILVSDNCSTDHTPELLQSYTDPRLTYYRQKENLGQRGNMNFLIDKAAGDYFLMLHDDDMIDPDFVGTCMEAAGYTKGTGLILTGSRVIDKEGQTLRQKENFAGGLSTEEFILFWYRKKVHMFFCCSLFGTEALREAGGFQDKYHRYDDVAAEFKCAASHGRIDVKAVKSSFREHPGSVTSGSDLAGWCASSLALLELACSLAPSKKNELKRIGGRTSAERLYRYAGEAESKAERLKGFWTVFRNFQYKQLPTKRNFLNLIKQRD